MVNRFVYRVVGIDIEDGEAKRDEQETRDSRDAAVRAAHDVLRSTEPPFDRVLVERRAVREWEHVMSLEAADVR
ncbi:MAG TPA: hypothetical protein VFF79_13020 [Conexibacter sp.]|nr:hypothetical protein [Conexibacter sp.]